MGPIYIYTCYVLDNISTWRVTNPIQKIATMFTEWRGYLLSDPEPSYSIHCYHQTPQGQSEVDILSVSDTLGHVLNHISLLNPGDKLIYSYQHDSTLMISHDTDGHYRCRHTFGDRPRASLEWIDSDAPYVSYHYFGKQLTSVHAVASLEGQCLELIENMAADLSVHVWDSQTDMETDQANPVQHFLSHLPQLQVGDCLRYRGYRDGAKFDRAIIIRRAEQGYVVRFAQYKPTLHVGHISFVRS